MKKIAIGVVTSPRHKPTVGRMLTALKFSYEIPHIHIFAEPLSDYPRHENQTTHRHEIKKGCFGNFDFAYRWLVENTDADYVLVLADDMKFKPDWFKNAQTVLSKIDQKDFGYLALYTPSGIAFAFENNPKHEVITLNREWGKGGWGGHYVIRRDVAKEILDHPFYENHKNNYEANQQFDECMKEVCYRMGLNQHYMNPSLFDHVGVTSTIGHEFRPMDKGLNYGRGI